MLPRSDTVEGTVGLANTLVKVDDPVPTLVTMALVTMSGVVRNVDPLEVSVIATAEVKVDTIIGSLKHSKPLVKYDLFTNPEWLSFQ